MSDGKIHIPARRKQPVDDQMVVKVTPEAYNALVEIYNESTLSLKQIANNYHAYKRWYRNGYPRDAGTGVYV